MPGGRRRVAEVAGLQGREIVLHGIYSFHSQVQGDEVLGQLEPTGTAPPVLEKLRQRGIAAEAGRFASVGGQACPAGNQVPGALQVPGTCLATTVVQAYPFRLDSGRLLW
jgi:hypothetical protein